MNAESYDSASSVGSFGPPSQVGMIVPTVSEEEQQGVRTNGEHLALLPRSVRWRIQLGLLQDPLVEATHGGEKTNCNLETVLDCNRETIFKQEKKFKELVEKYVEQTAEADKEQPIVSQSMSSDSNDSDDANATANPIEIDPLTAMVLEKEAQETRKAALYLKYRKEKARMKRGLTTEARVIHSESDEVDKASLIIIEKDLNRLPHPSETKGQINANSSASTTTPEQVEARITSLRQILYIYAQEHPTMGYRQGMHEIASYLLYVLELEYQEYPEHPLFNPILPISFALLERTLEHLMAAYDASEGKSLQQMSIAILGKILQNNPTLYHHLTNNPNIPPPPIYCTRWVRLMFSREVVGCENVFKLWDVLFSYANLMQALEITSASRILLMSDALLLPETNTLDLLMNVPPLTDISPLTKALEKLMKQRESDSPIQLQSLGMTKNHLNSSLPGRQPPQQHQRQSPEGESKFSFQNMRQSLGQKSESLRKKIITTTVEWKEAASRRDGSLPFDPLLAVNGMSSPRTVGNQGQNLGLQWQQQQETEIQRGYGEFAAPSGVATSVASNAVPISPRQHQHEMWSKLLQNKIWTVQQFLLDLESKENQGLVPRSVWEALADMDRMQRELLNYSRSNMGGGGNMY